MHFNCAEVHLKICWSMFDCVKVELLQLHFRYTLIYCILILYRDHTILYSDINTHFRHTIKKWALCTSLIIICISVSDVSKYMYFNILLFFTRDDITQNHFCLFQIYFPRYQTQMGWWSLPNLTSSWGKCWSSPLQCSRGRRLATPSTLWEHAFLSMWVH